MRVFCHSGDLGDVVSALPAIRQLGGGCLRLCDHVGPGGPREPMTPWRAAFLLRLIETQPYIKSATFGAKHTVAVSHDLSTFREDTPVRFGESLAHWHARHLGIEEQQLDLSPWLKVRPSKETKGRVVFARSQRYHNAAFPWRELVVKWPSALFVGTQYEHNDFCSLFGYVEYRFVDNALEMAQLIAGCHRFYGNQSLPCWIAMGLGHPLAQEVIWSAPNSIIRRPNAYFCGL